MIKRQLFICSARDSCRETANCCAHKIPHIKDERCIPRICRYGPVSEHVDCVPYAPQAPITTPESVQTVASTEPEKPAEVPVAPAQQPFEIITSPAEPEKPAGKGGRRGRGKNASE